MATSAHPKETQVPAHRCGLGLLLPSLTWGFICQISSKWMRDMLLSSPTLCLRHVVAAGPGFHAGMIYFGGMGHILWLRVCEGRWSRAVIGHLGLKPTASLQLAGLGDPPGPS